LKVRCKSFTAPGDLVVPLQNKIPQARLWVGIR
jgi:hypothetical protein